jgi:hypothetical protein
VSTLEVEVAARLHAAARNQQTHAREAEEQHLVADEGEQSPASVMDRSAQRHRVCDIHAVIADEDDRAPRVERRPQVLHAEKLVTVGGPQKIAEAERRSPRAGTAVEVPRRPNAIARSNRRARHAP